MPKIINNPIMKGLVGMLGKTLVYREVYGEVIVSNRPSRRKKPTAHQLKTKARFKEAVSYARYQIKTPERKGVYEKKIDKKMTSAYTVALSDFLNAPVIHNIFLFDYRGQVGNTITIDAEDDFEVISVTVTICDDQGVVVETGNAMLTATLHWVYTSTVDNYNLQGTKVIVKAADRAGNITRKEEGV